MRIKIIGAGRAGSSLARALRGVGHEVLGPVGRGADLETIAADVDVLVLAVSDDAIGPLAASITPNADCVVVHLSGSLGLDVLATHPRAGAMHPLIPLPNVEVGAARLASGATFAVAGDPTAAALAGSLGGRVVSVVDEDRARYHAAACIAANHVVALLGRPLIGAADSVAATAKSLVAEGLVRP